MNNKHNSEQLTVNECVDLLRQTTLAPLDLIPHQDIREKFIELVFHGVPSTTQGAVRTQFQSLRQQLIDADVSQVKVVVFGGGSGLSNVIGGDSRLSGWVKNPFYGLKEVFPQTKSIVCVTDDGGSTGELLKDLPLIALGDIRHVLLSSVQLILLKERYSLSQTEAHTLVENISFIFNFRFESNDFHQSLISKNCDRRLNGLPPSLAAYIIPFTAVPPLQPPHDVSHSISCSSDNEFNLPYLIA